MKILIALYSFYTTKLVKTDRLTDAFDLKMVTKSSINCKEGKKRNPPAVERLTAPLRQRLGSRNPHNLGMWCE